MRGLRRADGGGPGNSGAKGQTGGTPGKHTLVETIQCPANGAAPAGAPIQRRATPGLGEAAPTSTGTGSALPGPLQARMDGAFNFDFSAVRVHVGDEAAAIGAVAYTQGADLHFSRGQYDPDSRRGQELIGHELAHVVQQSEGRVPTTTQFKGIDGNDNAGLEREADAWGALAAAGESVCRTRDSGRPISHAPVQRQVTGPPDPQRVVTPKRPLSEIDRDIEGVNEALGDESRDSQDFVEKTTKRPLPAPNATSPTRPKQTRIPKSGREPSRVGTIAKALEEIMGDEKLPDDVRQEAQRRLNRLNGLSGSLEHWHRERAELEKRAGPPRTPKTPTTPGASPDSPGTTPRTMTTGGQPGPSTTPKTTGGTGLRESIRTQARSIAQKAASTARGAARLAIRAIPILTALLRIDNAIRTADKLKEAMKPEEGGSTELNEAKQDVHALGLDSLPSVADLRHDNGLDDGLRDGLIEELAWLDDNAERVLRTAPSRKTGNDDERMLSQALSDIQDRLERLNAVNINCAAYAAELTPVLNEVQSRETAISNIHGSLWKLMNDPLHQLSETIEVELLSLYLAAEGVEHHLGVLHTALDTRLRDYTGGRAKATTEWRRLEQIYNKWRPRMNALWSSRGFDTSRNTDRFEDADLWDGH